MILSTMLVVQYLWSKTSHSSFVTPGHQIPSLLKACCLYRCDRQFSIPRFNFGKHRLRYINERSGIDEFESQNPIMSACRVPCYPDDLKFCAALPCEIKSRFRSSCINLGGRVVVIPEMLPPPSSIARSSWWWSLHTPCLTSPLDLNGASLSSHP